VVAIFELRPEGFLIKDFAGAFCTPEGAVFAGGGAERPQIGFALLITKGLVVLIVLVDNAGAVGAEAVPVELALPVGLNFGTGGLVVGARAVIVVAFFLGGGGRARLVELALPASLIEADESTLDRGLF
jgi:hypothetical protein